MKTNMHAILYCYNMKFCILVRKKPGHTSTIGFLLVTCLLDQRLMFWRISSNDRAPA